MNELELLEELLNQIDESINYYRTRFEQSKDLAKQGNRNRWTLEGALEAYADVRELIVDAIHERE